MRFLYVRWVFLCALLFLGIGSSVVQAGDIQVTATIPPNSSTVSTSVSVTPTTYPIPQDTVLTVTIQYQATYSGSFPLVVQGAWGEGTLSSQSSPSIHSAEYVPNSATTGYGATAPIVDITNRTVRWNIPSFPSSASPQTIEFQIKTTSSYTGPLIVTFPVEATILSPVPSPTATESVEYQYGAVATPTPTPIPSTTPTASPTLVASTSPTPSPSPTSTPVVAAQLESIKLLTVQDTAATIGVGFGAPTMLLLRYGTQHDQLAATVRYRDEADIHRVFLNDLLPQTTYYFRIYHPLTFEPLSEIYTFTTASISQAFTQDENAPISLVVTRKGTVISQTPVVSSREYVSAVPVPKSSVIDVHLEVPTATSIQDIVVEIRVKGVLGVINEAFAQEEVVSSVTHMKKIGDTLYSAKLKVPSESGEYELVGHITYVSGALSEYILSHFEVNNSFTVLDERTAEPLENVRVYVERFNAHTQLYEGLPDLYGLSHNPAFTGTDGSLDMTLLPGKYRAHVSHFTYTSTSVEFEVSSERALALPTVHLTPEHGHLLTFFSHAIPVMTTIFYEVWQYAGSISHSKQFLHFLLFGMSLNAALAILYVWVICHYPSFQLSEVMYAHRKRMKTEVISLVFFLVLKLIFWIAETILLISSIFAYLFTLSFGWRSGFALAALCLFTFALYVSCEVIGTFLRHKKTH